MEPSSPENNNAIPSPIKTPEFPSSCVKQSIYSRPNTQSKSPKDKVGSLSRINAQTSSLAAKYATMLSTPSISIPESGSPEEYKENLLFSLRKQSKNIIPPWKRQESSLRPGGEQHADDKGDGDSGTVLDHEESSKKPLPLRMCHTAETDTNTNRELAFRLPLSTQKQIASTSSLHGISTHSQTRRSTIELDRQRKKMPVIYPDNVAHKSVGTNRVSRRTAQCQTESRDGDKTEDTLTADASPTRSITGLPKEIRSVIINGVTYYVASKIGQGGSSKVEKVINFNDGETYALKTVELRGVNRQTLDAFQKEIQILQKLQFSDKVIKLHAYDYRQADEKLLILLECGDTDLAEFIRRQDINSNLRRYYWHAMLEAVNILHEQGIIHSDIKPANFLLVAGQVKLIDFGIAKQLDADMTSMVPETVMGTMNYMPPEVLKNALEPNRASKVGRKADVWSLGCILYLMTYGVTPFQKYTHQLGKSRAITSDKVLIDYPDLEHEPLLLETIKMCMQREPKQRASIEDLLNHRYVN